MLDVMCGWIIIQIYVNATTLKFHFSTEIEWYDVHKSTHDTIDWLVKSSGTSINYFSINQDCSVWFNK